MTKTKNLKRAMLMSLLALIVCLSMFVGSTFAWFTDSVTSVGNIIKSGKLDVTMEWADGKTDPTNTTWTDASTGAIFNSELWEPGYVEVRHIKIANAGTLALKYQLNILANGAVSELADVIDVYYVDPAQAVENRDALANVTKIGTLSEVLAQVSTTAAGELKAGENHTITLALKMQETAGNEYQDKSIGSDFSVQLLATQLTSEEDAFDNQYDVASTWVGTIPASLEDTTLVIVPGGGTQTGTITVNSPEDLVYLNKLAEEWVSLYSNGQGTNVSSYRENVGGKGTDYYYHWSWTIELANDLNMSNIPMNSVDISYWDNFEGNGHTISNVILKDGQDGLFINGAKAVNNLTVKNITVNAPTAQTVGAVSGNGAMTNVHVVNATVIGGKYVGGICGKGSSFVNCSIKNSTVIGNDKTVGGLVGYSVGDPDAATVSGNVVENVTVTGAYNVGGLLGQSQNETVEGNTVKNVTLMSTSKLPDNASSNEVRAAGLAARSAFANTIIGNNTIENVTIDMVTSVKTATDLSTALASGENAVLTEDLENVPVETTAPYGNYYGVALNGGVFDGNGNTLDFDIGELKNGKVDNYGIMTSGGTIKNATITGVFRGIMIMNPTADVIIDNVVIGDEDVCYAINTGEGDGTHSLIVKNSTIKGWSSYGTAIKSVSFTNCTFAQGEYYTNVYGRLVKPYVNAVFDGCEFNSKFYIDLSQLGKDGDGNVLDPNAKIVLRNCTVNGVKLTTENWKDLIVSEDDCGEGQISIEAKDGSYMTASNVLNYVVIE